MYEGLIFFGRGGAAQQAIRGIDMALVREARRGLGDGVDLMIDAGFADDASTAIRRARQFAEYAPFWLEEPLHPDDIEGYRRLVEASPIRIAAGEQETTGNFYGASTCPPRCLSWRRSRCLPSSATGTCFLMARS